MNFESYGFVSREYDSETDGLRLRSEVDSAAILGARLEPHTPLAITLFRIDGNGAPVEQPDTYFPGRDIIGRPVDSSGAQPFFEQSATFHAVALERSIEGVGAPVEIGGPPHVWYAPGKVRSSSGGMTAAGLATWRGQEVLVARIERVTETTVGEREVLTRAEGYAVFDLGSGMILDSFIHVLTQGQIGNVRTDGVTLYAATTTEGVDRRRQPHRRGEPFQGLKQEGRQ